MLGYTQRDLADMTYGVWQADLLVNADENPAIINIEKTIKEDGKLKTITESNTYNLNEIKQQKLEYRKNNNL